ncbi:MAG: tetratricopeptide repeat protein [Myxococcales bacterium]|nr:tetratricopeptide repeat protein [Polyangiaceae bacterium]MDW8250388.1 tetratricopeptide repeat protein [Myxococcales bacterium]
MALTPEEQLDRAHWEAVEEVAEVLQEGQFHQALYLLRDVVRVDRKNPYVYYFMGIAFYELGQLEEARDAFRAAVKIAPGYIGARGSLAQVLRRLRDYRGAITEGKATLALRKDDPDALHALGMAYAALGQRSEARRYLEAFLRSRPEYEATQEAQLVLQLLERGHGPIEL